jgi:hypothetical protein
MPVVEYEGRLAGFGIEVELVRAAVAMWIELRGTG